jgi:nitrate reductase assembly molybdenum cofactor insertion protein NarJ
MNEPHVRTLAAELAECLDERQARYAAEFKRLVAEF